MPPSKKIKRQDGSSGPAAFPRNLAASIKRKTTTSARLAKPRSVGGIFSKPHNRDANQHTKNVSASISQPEPDAADSSQSNTLFSMLGRLSLKRRNLPDDNQMMFGGRGRSPSLESNTKPQSLLQSVRSRMSLRNRHEQGSVALGRVFNKPRTFEGPTTLRRTRGAVSL